jgi:hypothetical protein
MAQKVPKKAPKVAKEEAERYLRNKPIDKSKAQRRQFEVVWESFEDNYQVQQGDTITKSWRIRSNSRSLLLKDISIFPKEYQTKMPVFRSEDTIEVYATV